MSSQSIDPQAPNPASSKSAIRWLWLSVLVTVLDLGSKALVKHYMDFNDPLPIIRGFFDLRLLYNYGAAFSFLADGSGWQRWLFAAIAVSVVVGMTVWLTRMPCRYRWQPIAAALVIGGAVGNMYDRIVERRVTDFLSFHWQDAYHYPAFNIADSAIVIGMLMLIWDSLRSKKEAPASP